MSTKAWHLRQDGKSFPVQVHLYCMSDPDLMSEADVASFIIKTDSKDKELAFEVLDAYMAMLIEDTIHYDADSEGIEAEITKQLNHLPYHFAYPLPIDQMIQIHRSENHFNDVDSLYEYIDSVRERLSDLQAAIAQSFNQQFCRVRFGGKYNSSEGNNSIWFRISSVGYNWANTIYCWVAEHYRSLHIDNVTICRDPESDSGYFNDGSDYFYKARDGAVYYLMDIDEYLQEEHEHSVVFDATSINAGVRIFVKSELNKGATFADLTRVLSSENINCDLGSVIGQMMRKEIESDYIASSEWSDGLNTRTKGKVVKATKLIEAEFPFITVVNVDCNPRANTRGKMVGFEMIFKVESEIELLDHIEISIVSTKELGVVSAETLLRLFRIELNDYIRFHNVVI